MKTPESVPSEEERKRRERLEAMSKEEWHEAIRNFWRWFGKLRTWDKAKKTNSPRASQN